MPASPYVALILYSPSYFIKGLAVLISNEKLPSAEGVICSIVTTPVAPVTITVTGVPSLMFPT